MTSGRSRPMRCVIVVEDEEIDAWRVDVEFTSRPLLPGTGMAESVFSGASCDARWAMMSVAAGSGLRRMWQGRGRMGEGKDRRHRGRDPARDRDCTRRRNSPDVGVRTATCQAQPFSRSRRRCCIEAEAFLSNWCERRRYGTREARVIFEARRLACGEVHSKLQPRNDSDAASVMDPRK